MHSSKKIVALCFMSFVALAQAQVYKWKDKNGVIQYSDTPPASAKAEEIKPNVPVSSKAQAVVKDAKATEVSPDKLEVDAKKRQRQAELEKIEQENKAMKDKARAERCKAAQKNFNTYEQGGRIIDVNEKGERNYLSDEAIAKGKAEAKKIIVENCD